MAKDFFNGNNPSALEMLSYIDEDFFKRVDTKRKLMSFTRTFIDKYCEERNLSPVTLTSVEYARGHYATYMRYSGQLKLNNLLVKTFNQFKEANNFFYVQEYFDTILHELRHHEQFVSAFRDGHPIVKNSMQIMRRMKGEDIFDSHTYYFNPTELDARHFAYKTLKANKTLEPYYKHEDYIDDEISAEATHPFDFVELLKDPDLRGMKLISKPVKELEEQVKEIALKNGLKFVAVKERTEIESHEDQINNMLISSRVNAAIAPEFYSDDFVIDLNDEKVETRIDEEKQLYTNIIKELAEKDKARRAKRRAERKVEKAEKDSKKDKDAKFVDKKPMPSEKSKDDEYYL